MGNVHTHPRSDELHVFWVPADTDIKPELKVVKNHWEELGKLVGGYMEVATRATPPDLPCGCPMIMVVNEEGYLYNLEHNSRASLYLPDEEVVGDVLLVAQGPLRSEADSKEFEVDMFSLPDEMRLWEGPGAPLPDMTGWLHGGPPWL